MLVRPMPRRTVAFVLRRRPWRRVPGRWRPRPTGGKGTAYALVTRLRADAVEVAARGRASLEIVDAAIDVAERATALLEAMRRLDHALGAAEGENEGVV